MVRLRPNLKTETKQKLNPCVAKFCVSRRSPLKAYICLAEKMEIMKYWYDVHSNRSKFALHVVSKAHSGVGALSTLTVIYT